MFKFVVLVFQVPFKMYKLLSFFFIGQKYAWVAMKLQLSTLLRNFRFYTDMKMEDIEYNIDFIIRSKCGYKVKLEYRKKE